MIGDHNFVSYTHLNAVAKVADEQVMRVDRRVDELYRRLDKLEHARPAPTAVPPPHKRMEQQASFEYPNWIKVFDDDHNFLGYVRSYTP